MVNWEELPQEILELIDCRLAIEDFLAFGGVCTSWRSAATKETYKAKSEAPWLMIYEYNQIIEFSSPSTGRIYPMRVLGSHVQTLSVPGWILALQGDGEYRILNPLSHISIELPALEKLHHKSCLIEELDRPKRIWRGTLRINMMALSSSPSLSRSYTVMISYTRSLGFAFHRSGEDAWTAVNLATNLRGCTAPILGLIYYKGLFVALNANCEIMTLNERKRRMEWRLDLGQSYAKGDPYLVECSGSLLVAWAMSPGYCRLAEEIRVCEVDLEKGTEEEVETLGNMSLVLNGTSSFSVEFNPESCFSGIKPNHVYFPDHYDDQMKSYSMEDGEFETYFDAPAKHSYKWFQPHF